VVRVSYEKRTRSETSGNSHRLLGAHGTPAGGHHHRAGEC
jgi:hypothetical protein